MKTTVFCQVSIDGKLTLGSGYSSKELFSLFDEEDMRFIHETRGTFDAIMVGKNTILTDNPLLTNRFEKNKNPVRIVPTSTMDIPLDANIFRDNEKTIIVTTAQGVDKQKLAAIKALGKECLICGQKTVDFAELFMRLERDYGIHSIMVEGGGSLNWCVFDQGLVDEIILMQIPIIVGGADNVTLVEGRGYHEVTRAKKYTVTEVRPKKNFTLMHYQKAA